ncbi:MAG: universal stress protein [Acidobacteria bacterium]|nr:universal stress protein [Acidobacteriota bacterium]
MKSIQKILFPVDFSEHCAQVAIEVFGMARRLGAEVLALHVLESSRDDAAAERELELFLAGFAEGVVCEKRVRSGHAASEILKAVDEEAIDFVAMPSRGRSALQAFLFGSITERVLHKASCPVWTENQSGNAADEVGKILCCVDLSPASEEVLDWAERLAVGFEAELAVAHVGHGDGALVELRRLVRDRGSCEIVTGEVEETILRHAAAVGADLLVIGRGEERSAMGRFRSHAQTLIRKAPCAVFSV